MSAMAKKRGLGRKGLDALLSNLSEVASDDVMQMMDVDLILRGQYQPRSDFDPAGLERLAASIRAQGVIQPIVIRPIAGTDKYEIIVGERRWRAAQLADVRTVPVVIRDVTDRAATCMALVENIQRQDLNPLEEAEALTRLIGEFELTHQAAADAIGQSRSAVTNLLRLLELSPRVKALLKEGALDMGHARALLVLPAAQQLELARQVVEQGLSVRATEKRASAAVSPAKSRKKTGNERIDPDVRVLQDELSAKLGAEVKINHRKQGKGRIEIQYYSHDELQGILQRIR